MCLYFNNIALYEGDSVSYSTEYRTVLVLQRELRYKKKKRVCEMGVLMQKLFPQLKSTFKESEYFWLICITGCTR